MKEEKELIVSLEQSIGHIGKCLGHDIQRSARASGPAVGSYTLSYVTCTLASPSLPPSLSPGCMSGCSPTATWKR